MKDSKRVNGAFGKFNSCQFTNPKIAKVENGYIILCYSVKGYTDYILGYNEDFTDGVFQSYSDAKNWWNSSKSEYKTKLVGAYH